MNAPLDKHINVWRLVAAILGVPAGLAGTYAAYHSYAAGGMACAQLSSSIVEIIAKDIPPDAKRKLLRASVQKFDKVCGESDPDAQSIFDAALTAPPAAPHEAVAATIAADHPGQFTLASPETPANSSHATFSPPIAQNPAAAQPQGQSSDRIQKLAQYQAQAQSQNQAQPHPVGQAALHNLPMFGSAKATEHSGWVPLVGRNQQKTLEAMFDVAGAPVSPTLPPAVGAVLTARRAAAVLHEPATTPDKMQQQARVAAGQCVRLLAIKTATPRLWSEVEPASCN
jgi:hypothetical protein